MKKTMCYCGKPLHYTDKRTSKFINEMVRTLGEFVNVIYLDKIYKVPRHYIALHGIKGYQLGELGFEEVI